MNKCELCIKGNLKTKEVKNMEFPTSMGIITIEGVSKLEVCDHCKEVLIPGKLIDYWNRLIMGHFSKKKGYLTPQELQFIFSVLPYTQAELAAVMGKERSTLTKYKNGENPIDPLFDDALRRIMRDFLDGKEETMKSLKQRHEFVSAKDTPLKKVRVR